MLTRAALFTVFALATALRALAADVAQIPAPVLKVPDGFSIELVAGPPLVERPIVASFDDEGRLYVAESSGSNDPVKKQLEDRPHRIARLEDTDGDGKFDRRTTFADHMMFPEGTLFFDGSLYVGAPPSIWKLTDTNNDGIADERVEWFQGKTLTGCANDLHGPYAGPDGWIYWCKGAFAEQTHIVRSKEWTTKASHVFRCRPDGSGFEPVITCGMDNPVDVVFMPDGEMILSGTLFQGNPRRDGLAHAVYGGVYGKEHNVLDGHPRTGELMPVFDSMSPVACSGLERYDSDVFGPEYRDNLFLCQFNVRKVSRHILKPSGSTYTSEDSDFVSSDFVDFHPTDVVVDADGSLLVVDTGGWYKLCCPTSQLYRPDVLGGIYRVRRKGAKQPYDPRGRKIAWTKFNSLALWALLPDSRPMIRHRAIRELVRRKGSQELQQMLADVASRNDGLHTVSEPYSNQVAMTRVWVLSQIDTPFARSLVRHFLSNPDERVRHVALKSISLHRDSEAVQQLIKLLIDDSPAIRRTAAEALGRIGDRAAVPHLLAAAAKADDRIIQHSIIYALIENADPAVTRKGLADKSLKTVAAALIALDQMAGGNLQPGDVIPHLGATDETLHQAARWVVSQHPEWGSELAQWFNQQLKSLPDESQKTERGADSVALANLLVTFSSNPTVQQLLADALRQPTSPLGERLLALSVMTKAKPGKQPAGWVDALTKTVEAGDAKLLPLAIAAIRSLPPAAATNRKLSQAVIGVAETSEQPVELRVDALAIVSENLPALSESQFALLTNALSSDNAVPLRAAAADALSKSHLSNAQLNQLCGSVQSASPLELNRLLKPYEGSTDEGLGLKLVASLKKSAALPSLRLDLLREALAKYSPSVQQGVAEIESLVNVAAAAQRKHIEELLPLVAKGDIRRGNAVFFSSKATCSSCHRLGNAGGTTGPELTHIGDTRTERDILESVLYPSLSFVRSFEPVLVITTDGKTINGTIHDETADEYVLATGPDQQVRVRRDEVDDMQPSKVSIMPAGLDKQLSPQELADLVAFLKNGTGKK